jgi:transcription elongation GreA/GreB family factor
MKCYYQLGNSLDPTMLSSAAGSRGLPYPALAVREQLDPTSKEDPMTHTADRQTSHQTASSGQHRPPRAPEPAAAVVLTPEGQRQLATRAARLATELIPRVAPYYLDDPDQDGWASVDYGQAVTELALLTNTLQRAITTDQLPPENPGIVELGDEVMVEFANGYTHRFLVVDPIEAPLDDLRISVESPLAQALVGRRVGAQVEVEEPDGGFRCRILATGRHQMAAAARPRPMAAG